MKKILLGIFLGVLLTTTLYLSKALANTNINEAIDQTANRYCTTQISYGIQYNLVKRCPANHIVTGVTSNGLICSTLTIQCFN